MIYDMHDGPITISDLLNIINMLTSFGSLKIVNCKKTGPDEGIRIINLLSRRSSDDDLGKISQIVRKEMNASPIKKTI